MGIPDPVNTGAHTASKSAKQLLIQQVRAGFVFRFVAISRGIIVAAHHHNDSVSRAS